MCVLPRPCGDRDPHKHETRPQPASRYGTRSEEFTDVETSQDAYNGPATLSSPNAPLPESRGDRATLRAILAWLGHVRTPAGRVPTSSVRLVWASLFAHADLATGEAHPRLSTIATLCALSLRCVRTCVRTLESLGLVRSTFRTGHATLYRLTLPQQL